MFKFLTHKATPVWSIIVSGKEGQPVWAKFNQTAAARTYANIDTVYSCVDIIASGFSQAEFRAVTIQRDGTKVDNPKHPALELLANPAPQYSQQSLGYAYAAWKLITGNSYLFLNNGDDGNFNKAPSEINVFNPARMKVIPNDMGIMAYKYSLNGVDRRFPVDVASGASNVIHSRLFNPTDDFYGLSPMQAAAKNIDIYDATLTWNKSLLDNSCRPSGMFTWTGEGNPSADQVSDIRKMIQKHTGGENAGKPLFGGKLDFKQMSMSPKDVEFVTSKTMTMKDIARVYKVPPVLLNIGSDATFSNMAEARLALWDEAIIPMLSAYVNELNATLMQRYPGEVVLELDLNGVTSLEPRREKQWARAGAADFLTTNERRRIVGYSEVDDGDDILVPSSSVPLSFATGDLLLDSGDDQKKN